jgi:hypothetical protein
MGYVAIISGADIRGLKCITQWSSLDYYYYYCIIIVIIIINFVEQGVSSINELPCLLT